MAKKKHKRRHKHGFGMMILSLSVLVLVGTMFAYWNSVGGGKSGNTTLAIGETVKNGITDLTDYFTGSEDDVYAKKTTSVDSLKNIESYNNGIYSEVYSHIDTFAEVSHRKLKIQMSNYGNYRLINDSNQNFNVLQVTDVHLTGADVFYSKDIQALDAMYTMISRAKPDFIVMTGDLIFETGGVKDGERAWNVLCNVMDRIGIPWTWTFGNHDHDFFDKYSADAVDAMLSQCNTLCMYPDNSVYGYSNGTIELCNKDGSLAMGLIMIDSNDMLIDSNGNLQGYDYIRADEVDWYSQEIIKLKSVYGENVRTMVYFHIPLMEYNVGWNLVDGHLAGESIFDGVHTAKYIGGRKREPVQGSTVASDLFVRAVESKSTVAMFCGHDHLNDYDIELDGIQLIYGKSIDYIAYPGIELETEQRGATLVTIDSGSGFAITPMTLE